MKLFTFFTVFCLLLFLGNTNGQILKSTMTEPTFYSTYETFNWDGINAEWTNSTVSYYTRSTAGNVLVRLTNVWDGANGLFNNSTKETYTYDASNRIKTYLLQTWKTVDGILDWTNTNQTVYVYNASGLMTSSTESVWKLVNGKYIWANVNRHLYSYNAQSLKSEDRYQTGKQDTIWDDIKKTLYVYDAKKNITEQTEQKWNATTWANDIHHLYKYNASNKVTEDVQQTWDIGLTTPAWENVKKTTYAYDTKGLGNQIMYHTWNKGALPPVWDTTEKDTIIYNAKNWVYQTIHQNYVAKAWTDYKRTTDNYDGYQNITEEVVDYWGGISWDKSNESRKWIRSFDIDKNLTTQITQNWSTTAYVNTLKEVFSDFKSYTITPPTVDKKEADQRISVYPNPVTNVLNVSINGSASVSTIVVTDLNGRIVYENKTAGTQTAIEAHGLAAGVYIVTVTNGENVVVEKIIKE